MLQSPQRAAQGFETSDPFRPPPIRPVSEDHGAADFSSDSIQKYQYDHSYGFIDESLFDGIPLTRRRVYEWGFALQDQGALQDPEDDTVLQDFRSAFVPDLETPVDWAPFMPPLEKYDTDGDAVIQSLIQSYAARAGRSSACVRTGTICVSYYSALHKLDGT